jgi:precorrin-3B synthase
MSALAIDDMRRGWCPSVLRPMQTGDGLLVRLHPRAARLTSARAHAIAAAARACGNGLIDLSSRGNLQIRGVRPETHACLVALLSAAGLDDAAHPRACILSPLAGVDPSELVDPAGLADAVEAALAHVESLPAKFAVVVDGGGLPLDDIEADVRLVALGRDRLAVAIAAPDGLIWIGACALREAPAVVCALASALCEAMRDGEQAHRMRDLAPATRARVAAAVALASTSAAPPRVPARSVGATTLAGGALAVGFGVAFGRLDADLLDRVAELAERFGAGELRLSPWRSIILSGVAPNDVSALLTLAEDGGLILDEDDPRRAIAACTGAPSCPSAAVTTQADATRLAAEARDLLSPGMTVHLSGCVKGCARRSPADLTLVGEDGPYGVVIRGDARQAPIAHMDIDDILRRLRMLGGEGPLASLSTARLVRAFAEAR